MILFLYFKICFILTYFKDSIFIEQNNSFIYQNKQKIVQTLLKWLFWTNINLDIIKQNIILAEVFVSILGGGVLKIFKQNKWLVWFIFTQNLLLHRKVSC